ncbi:MAG: TIGR02301 family protein [Rhizobiaceae bacterium]|nr:TIGR02301 family protein [Rhizobiaceae bacterium]
MLKRTLVLILFASLSVAPAAGQQKRKAAEDEAGADAPVAAEKPAPYDPKLMRLAEILGSVSYIRNLCKGDESEWRQMMQELLAEDAANEPQRAARLTAAFNRGYRSFASTYVKCTRQAIAAEEAYRAEGATLATEITARFGN